YWIKQGDALMFRAALILLLAILCLALGLATFSSYRSQRQMDEQMAALAEQLQALADSQRTSPSAAPIAAEPKPLEITGKVFIGSPDKPAADTEVMICRVSDGEIVRLAMTADDGSFRSGPLTPGDYTLVARGVKHSSWKRSI